MPWACTSDELPADWALAPMVPDDVLFGAVVAGFHVSPGSPSLPAERWEDQHSDWYQWVTIPELIAPPGRHLSGDPLSLGPGHRERQDFALAVDELNQGALRTSIEWSRLSPTTPGVVRTGDELTAAADLDAVAAYHPYFAEGRINRPGIINPPGAIDVAFAMIDAHAMIDGYAAMYDAVHANDSMPSVGLFPILWSRFWRNGLQNRPSWRRSIWTACTIDSSWRRSPMGGRIGA